MLFSDSVLIWLEIVLKERFGCSFQLQESAGKLLMSAPGRNGLIIFHDLQSQFHKSSADIGCHLWDSSTENLNSILKAELPMPSQRALPNKLVSFADSNVDIYYDLLGMIYWVLSRQEEVGSERLDEHGRFPATSSHAFRYGYLERPLVDEWMHILKQVIQYKWPELSLETHQFSIKVSHDVDSPSRYGFRSVGGITRAVLGDVLKRKDFKSTVIGPWIRLSTKSKLHRLDQFNTFDWLMSVSERNRLSSAFYFICGRTHPTRDADYEPNHPAIKALMREIHNRGHEIGLHPSFNSFRNPEIIKSEFERLRALLEELSITQPLIGGRMHYLRWEQPTTLLGWEHAGLNYDSTLGYADHAGFRCGTCFEYPAIDPVSKQILNLRIRPLIAMEGTVISDMYMGLGTGEEALNKFLALKQACEAVSGCFTLLWHNSQLMHEAERELYEEVLSQ